MKILVHDYAGHPFQIQLSRALAEWGHEVLHAYAGGLQTPRGDLVKRADDPPSFSVSEVQMDDRYAKYKYSFLRRRRMEIEYGYSVASLITGYEPDVVISSNTPTETQASILRASEQVDARFIYWLQDFYSIAVDKLLRKKIPLLGRLIGAYYKRLEKEQLQRSQAVVAITDDFVPLLRDSYGIPRERISVIPNWAPLESIPLVDKANDWSRSHQLDDKFCFLYTGTLGMKHNPKLLSNLANRFREHEEVRVVVVSEGLGADWLKKTKEKQGLNNLVILPYQPFSSLPSVLASGDVLLGVLEEEAGIFSVPSKVLTYLCAGRPILLAVPEVNLASRIIRDQRAGFTVPPSDSDAFLEKAQRLLQSPDLAEACGENARDYAEYAFDILPIADRFEEIFDPAPVSTHAPQAAPEAESRIIEERATLAVR